MTKKFLLAFTTAALAISSAATHRITLFQPTQINGTELKPGEYKMEIKDNKVTLLQGKSTVQADVTVQNVENKYNTNAVRYNTAGGRNAVQEIHVGGTKMKLVFDQKEPARGPAE